ncbi:MAG: TolB family protein, partial [Pyrinomonadaceae bacterium]
MPIEGGEATELSDRHAYEPSVFPDGKLVAFFSSGETENNLVVIPAAGGEPVRVYDNAPDTRYATGYLVRWTPDGRLLTYIDNVGEASNIRGQPVDVGTARQLTKFEADTIFSRVDRRFQVT